MNANHVLPMDVRKASLEAENRIRHYIRETPLIYSAPLSRRTGCRVHLKLENWQITRSFKLRGAFNKILSVEPEAREKGVVTASSGNHGAAVAHVVKQLGLQGKIVLPETASSAKVEALLPFGVDIVLHGNDCVLAEKHGRRLADEEGLLYIPPYNDPQIVGGQGTIAVELERQLDRIDACFVPVGGGGLIGGIGGTLKSVSDRVRITGCQPENSAVMAASLRAGHILDIESKPTISDGSAGGIEPGSITFDLCRAFVDDFVLVSEDEIRDALMIIMRSHQLFVEGSAVLSVAALLKRPDPFEGQTVVLIISGAKISLDQLKSILCEDHDHGQNHPAG